jgi:muramidase (phage lysozyme)
MRPATQAIPNINVPGWLMGANDRFMSHMFGTLPKVEITYHNVYSKDDEENIETHLDNKDEADANAKALNDGRSNAQKALDKKKKEALACEQEIARLGKLRHPTAHDAEKLAAEQKKKTVLAAELKTTEAEAKAAQAKANDARNTTASAQSDVDRDVQKATNNDFKDEETTTIEQPDLLHTLPGDLIVYETVMKGLDPHSSSPSLDYPGHVDIRTYHGFYSDFVSAYPLAVLGNSGGRNVYKVIGVFRNISDTMALARVEAFLRIIREYAVGEKSPEDRDQSYKVLSYDKDNKEKPIVWIEGGLGTHPGGDTNDISSGAYQLKYRIWNDSIKRMGWPRTFEGKMQDRVVMYLLQSTPGPMLDDAHSPRHSALGYIMEGDLDMAVNEPKLIKLYPFLPGGKKEQLTMTALNTKFKQYLQEITNV